MSNQVSTLLQKEKLIPVVTFFENDNVIDFAEFLLSQNVNCIEITLRTPFGMSAIKQLKKAYPNMKVGAGTVVNTNQINELIAIDVDFMVSPGFTNTLAEAYLKKTVPFLLGVSSPSEIIKAMEYEIDALKFFPAHLNGGLKALKMYNQLFPTVNFCPTGGITSESSAEYLALPNVFSVGGSWFQKNYTTKKK